MSQKQVGFTKADPTYPGYINATQDGDNMIVTVRSDPRARPGVYVCGYAKDKGHYGRCTPGDEHCNNYCNSAPEKGPMADAPKAFGEHMECGLTASIKMSKHDFQKWLEQVNAL